jgi:hypothetical protein
MCGFYRTSIGALTKDAHPVAGQIAEHEVVVAERSQYLPPLRLGCRAASQQENRQLLLGQVMHEV